MFTNKQLKALIIPLIFEQILAVTVGMTDTFMVSEVGEAAVSGVAIVDTINILLINLFASLSTGGAVIAAHRLGEKNREKACKTADQLLLCVTVISVVVMIFSLAGNRFLLNTIFVGVEEKVMDNAVIYFYVTALSFPFLAIYGSSAALCRSMGNAKITMYISLVVNIINIIGNAILIYVFNLGVFGAAVSTLVSRVLGAVITLVLLHNQNKEIHYDKHFKLGFKPRIIKEILRIGVPTGVDNCIFQVGKILVQSLVAGLGTAALAANSVASVIAGCAVIPAAAIGIALITVTGQCIGAGEYEQAKMYVKRLMKYSYIAMAIVNVVIIFSAKWIVGIYKLSPKSMELAIQIVIVHSILAIFLWTTGFALPNVLRASFDAPFTMYISIFSMWTFRIGLCYLFVKYLDIGVLGVWFAMGIDWLFRSICFLIRFNTGKWLNHVEG